MIHIFRSVLLFLKDVDSGDIQQRVLATGKAAVISSPLAIIMEYQWSWFNENGSYVFWVLCAISIDWVLGVWKHLFKIKDFNFKDMGIGLGVKILLCVCAGFLFEGVEHFLKGQPNVIVEYLQLIFRISVFLYPATSALASMYIISNGTFPPKVIMDRTNKFSTTLKVKDLNSDD